MADIQIMFEIATSTGNRFEDKYEQGTKIDFQKKITLTSESENEYYGAREQVSKCKLKNLEPHSKKG